MLDEGQPLLDWGNVLDKGGEGERGARPGDFLFKGATSRRQRPKCPGLEPPRTVALTRHPSDGMDPPAHASTDYKQRQTRDTCSCTKI